MTGEVWTVVVAAGSGRRFGTLKQFVSLGGRPLVAWAIDAAAMVSDGVVLVLPAGGAPIPEGLPAVSELVPGGATRSESVRAGLAAVPSSAEVVLVHDGARPMADEALFRRLIDALDRTHGDGEPPAGAVPGIAVADTLRGRDGAPIDRDAVVAVQTPQAFRADVLRRAHAGAAEATDDASLCEAIGERVAVVEGDPANLKVTTPSDLAVAESLLAAHADDTAVPGGEPNEDPAMSQPATGQPNTSQPGAPDLRVGNGFDIHRFTDDPDRRCILGGVVFDDSPGLEAHSDGDAVAHSVAEALLGAVGMGDIGTMFPDTDPAHADADSMALLAQVVQRLAGEGWRAVNVDCSIVAERPKLAPHRAAMVDRLSAVVGAPVSVKGRRAEGVGSIGAGEAVVALASALVVRP